MTEVQNPKIHAQIVAVMRDVEAIGKDRSAPQYKFRGIDDVYNMLHAILAKHGVFTVPEVLEWNSEERQTKSGGVSIYRVMKIRYRFYAEDGSHLDAVMIGEGADSGDKAANKAMSVAQKYAFLQVFAIPTEDPKDPENDNDEMAPRKGSAAALNQAAGRGNTGNKPAGNAQLAQSVKKCMDAFYQDHGVGARQVLARVKKNRPEEMTAADLEALRGWFDELNRAKAEEGPQDA